MAKGASDGFGSRGPSRTLTEGNATYRLAVGRRQRVMPGSIVGALANEGGLSSAADRRHRHPQRPHPGRAAGGPVPGPAARPVPHPHRRRADPPRAGQRPQAAPRAAATRAAAAATGERGGEGEVRRATAAGKEGVDGERGSARTVGTARESRRRAAAGGSQAAAHQRLANTAQHPS